MKPVFKLSGSLILNQFLADIACGMCVFPFPMLFSDSLFTYLLFSAFIIFFFYYISYHGAYKVGFHDVGRHSSEQYDKGYLKRGVLASLIAASPTILMFVLWKIGAAFNIMILKALQFPLFLWTMYGYWPLSHIFPNHITTCFLLCIAMQLIFPMIGYVSGYKGIVYTQKIKDALFHK